MGKMFFFSVCLLLVILGNAVSARPSFRLQSLCGQKSTNGTYSFNSFYQLKLSKSLKPLSSYFLCANCFVGQKGVKFDCKGSKKFISKLFIKNLNETKTSKKFTLEELDNFQQMSFWCRIPGYIFEREYRGVWPEEGANLYQLMTILKDLNENRLSEHLVPFEELKNDLKILREANQDLRSAFKNQLIDVFYEEPIALIDDFTLDRKNEPTYLDDSSIAQISFSLYVPFYDSSLSADGDGQSPCTCAQRLPKFYPQESCGDHT